MATEQNPTTTQNKDNKFVWYKKWWVWLIIVIAAGNALDKDKEKSSSTSQNQPAETQKAADPVLIKELQTWLSSSSWKCVDADGGSAAGMMKGAKFEFSPTRIRIQGDGVEVAHDYSIVSIRNSGGAGGCVMFATLKLGNGNEESLMKLEPDSGFEFAGMSWGKGECTMKLARNQGGTSQPTSGDKTSSASTTEEKNPESYADSICFRVKQVMARGTAASAPTRGSTRISFGSRTGDTVPFTVVFTPEGMDASDSITFVGTMRKNGVDWKWELRPR